MTEPSSGSGSGRGDEVVEQVGAGQGAVDEDTPTVSSQGSQPASPLQQVTNHNSPKPKSFADSSATIYGIFSINLFQLFSMVIQ